VAAADRYGDIKAQFKKQGLPLVDMAALIAAHALAENLILVTNNTRHFERVSGLRVEDWTA
jgi:tRNA(fMet)-specific endonuclease VapC